MPDVSELTPYIPRVTLDWLRAEPEAIARELEGTMAFVDISGFTALSERLSERGKAGAEEVTEVVNATFGHLLEVAYSYGGSVLKFGGDALLLFFAGDRHAERACRASYGMRRTLGEHRHVRTPAGDVELRMHVGVNSGRFHFFLVGESHRELIVTGPETGRTVLMEATAEAGEILLTPAAAAELDAAVLGEPKGEGVLLSAEPEAPTLVEWVPTMAGIDLSICVPAGIRAHLAAAQAEPEHRQAAVAFLAFSGVDRLLADGVLAAAGAIRELVSIVQAAAAEHDVTFLESDVDRDGGRIVLVAGAPQTVGDDEDRLLRTARAVIEARTVLPVRVGVNRGRVFAGEVGTRFRRTYAILGDTAALAARLMARAEPGTVLASADVVERARSSFETRALEPFAVKGRSQPVEAYEVREVRAVRRAAEERRLPLVDRQRELAVLSASLAPARSGFGSLVELVGETGIGKSRLVRELQSQAADLDTITSVCEPYDTSTPYHAFRGLLRELADVRGDADAVANAERLRARLDERAPDLVPWIPLLAVPLDLPVASTREVDELDPSFRRARLHGVVTSLMRTLLAQPTLLVFEDAHWMDEASSDLLRHLGAEVTQAPWLACVTRRPVAAGFSATEGVPPIPALTMRLEPLPRDDARALVALAADSHLPAHEVEAIVERAGGNPLFLRELASAADEPAGAGDLPESVEALVTARIDGLAPEDRALLRWASVLGLRFAGDLLAEALVDEPSVAAGSDAWERLLEFVERDPDNPGDFRFRQAVFRDAAYEGLSFRRRRELHARVAVVLERREAPPETLSLHFFRGEQHDRAWTHSLAAGERARAKFANVEAARFYRRALEVSPHLPGLTEGEIVGVWEALGDVSELAGAYTDAAEAYHRARETAEVDGTPQPGLLRKEGIIRERTGEYEQALEWYERALDAVGRLDDPGERQARRARLLLDQAGVRLRQGAFGDCIACCREALEDAFAVDDQASVANAYYLLHLAYTELGSPEREAYRGLALPIYEELGDLLGQANVLNNLGIDAYYEGRWGEALDVYGRSRDLRERIGDVVGAATITNNIGEIQSDQGRLEEASAAFREAYEVCEAAGYRLICHVATGNLGRLAARAARLDEAETLLREALAGFERIHAESFILETEARLAERDLLAGEHESALARATATLERTTGSGDVAHLRAQLERIRGGAELQRGDLVHAREHLEAGLRIARAARVDYEAALALELLAVLERHSGSAEAMEDRLAEGREILRRLGVTQTPRVPLSGRPPNAV